MPVRIRNAALSAVIYGVFRHVGRNTPPKLNISRSNQQFCRMGFGRAQPKRNEKAPGSQGQTVLPLLNKNIKKKPRARESPA